MKIQVTKSLEEVLNLKENPVSLHRLVGKSALVFTPYYGDRIINKIRKRMIQDLTEESERQEESTDPKAIRTYANFISGIMWLSKYYLCAEVAYRLYNLF